MRTAGRPAPADNDDKDSDGGHPNPVLDLVVPVHNEEKDLERCVRRLHAHLVETFPYSFRITVADNASTDATPRIAARLARELPGTCWIRLAEKGRGRALHTAWSGSGPRCSRTWTWTFPPVSRPCCPSWPR
ncbi:Glycosyl transferase family 2 [Streptomyces sp. AVP053U2]|nr:Glycosyl transferase family 2 [Streptomyces sp. AVP053U2]